MKLSQYYKYVHCLCSFSWSPGPMRTMAASFLRFLDHIKRSITVGRVSLGRVIGPSQRPLPDNTQQSQQMSKSPVGFEPTISTGERPQTYAFDRSATEIGKWGIILLYIDIIICIIQVFLFTFCLFPWEDFLLKPPGGYPIAVNKYIISYHLFTASMVQFSSTDKCLFRDVARSITKALF